MNLFKGFINWIKKKKEKPEKADENINGINPDEPDYEAHVYLKEKFGYGRKIRRAIIHNYKKRGGKLD